jgi:N-acetylglutamate synthase-like GNAT family acetyltransferase
MKIRKFQRKDARRCYNIIAKCLKTVNKEEDSPQTLDNLRKDNLPQRLIEKTKEWRILVAEDNGYVLGLGAYDSEGILHSFFIDPKSHHQGIGSAILKRIEEDAKKQGIKVITAYSSLFAEGFYSKKGYRRIKKGKVPYKGDMISFIKMEKKLR